MTTKAQKEPVKKQEQASIVVDFRVETMCAITQGDSVLALGSTIKHPKDEFNEDIARKWSLFRAIGGTHHPETNSWTWENSDFDNPTRLAILRAYLKDRRERGNRN